MRVSDPRSAPCSRGGSLASAVLCAEASQGRARQFCPVFDESVVPMVLLDDGRRSLSANRASRLLLRLSLAELRQCRMDDLMSADKLDLMRSVWDRFMRTGSVVGNDVVEWAAGAPPRPAGGRVTGGG